MSNAKPGLYYFCYVSSAITLGKSSFDSIFVHFMEDEAYEQ